MTLTMRRQCAGFIKSKLHSRIDVAYWRCPNWAKPGADFCGTHEYLAPHLKIVWK